MEYIYIRKHKIRYGKKNFEIVNGVEDNFLQHFDDTYRYTGLDSTSYIQKYNIIRELRERRRDTDQ